MTSSLLCPNDWEIKRLFVFIGAIQIGLIASLMIDSASPLLSITRILFGFLYVIVIPGVLILRNLHLHNLGPSRTLIYIVTLSLAFDMFLGLIAVLPFLIGVVVDGIFPAAGVLGGYQSLIISSAGLLIVVGVVLDTMKQIEAQLMMRNYEGFIR